MTMNALYFVRKLSQFLLLPILFEKLNKDNRSIIMSIIRDTNAEPDLNFDAAKERLKLLW